MRIDSSGNVGIGTSSPSAKLDVIGNVRLFGTTGNLKVVLLNNGGETTLARDDSTGSQFGIPYATNLFASGAYPVLFWVNGSERMRITSAGIVLIGTTVSGGSGGTTISGREIRTNAETTAYANHHIFTNPNGDRGAIYTDGNNTIYANLSDYRLKQNIAPMTGALAKVSALKPVTYTWKVDGSDGQGFIAHELQEVVPDCVVGEKDAVNKDGSIKPQAIDTSFLVATLTAAIQEQQAIITDLKARIEALEIK
jgi:hypothetical protein